MNKPPSFQFYPKDWFDYKVMRMSYEAQGIYMRILSHMWKDSDDMCSFPKNSKIVCRILGISARKWTKIYNEFQKHYDPIFIENEHKFISKRLQKEAQKLMEYRRLSSEGGKKSAKKRWDKKGKGGYKGTYKGTGKGEVTLQSSSSSSSSLKEKKSKKRKAQKKKKYDRKKHLKEYAQYVFLTEEEYKRFINEYGEVTTKKFIEKLNNYKGSHDRKYADDNLTIRNWVIKEILGEEKSPSDPYQNAKTY